MTRFLLASCLVLVWSGPGHAHHSESPGSSGPACATALAARREPGGEIERMQRLAAIAPDPVPYLERLGWEFVAEARKTHDAAWLALAADAASCIESRVPEAAEALLLRGHVLVSHHRFAEAEVVARKLVARRGAWFDHALLGDALLDQGRVDEAIASYERVMAERPGPEAYSRAAHVRRITGDLAGAIEAMTLAARSADARDPASAAWFRSTLARYELEAGHPDVAAAWIEAALAVDPDHPDALFARGLYLLGGGRAAAAVEPLARSVAIEPLPAHLWALAEALRETGRVDEAEQVEARLAEEGASEDPRTLALFLAATGRDPARALRLAERELETRRDVFTLDALALALAGVGRIDDARTYSTQALARGTRDARLYLHAALIAKAAGDDAEAARRIEQTRGLAHMLLPSERRQLDALAASTRHPVGTCRS